MPIRCFRDVVAGVIRIVVVMVVVAAVFLCCSRRLVGYVKFAEVENVTSARPPLLALFCSVCAFVLWQRWGGAVTVR